MYAIVTPTFQPHFGYVNKYLQSFQKYLLDPENVTFYFTISREEKFNLEKIVKKYNKLNVQILFFEDILKAFDIEETPDELLQKYHKFSFQTLKKFYTMLYIKEQYSLILDSESMAVKPFHAENLFKDFFTNPFISGSMIENRFLSEFTSAVNENVNFSLKQDIPFWFLENFVWFYDKNILNDLFTTYGTPLNLVKNVYDAGKENPIRQDVGIFEIELYQAYVWKNLNKYHYNFFDINSAFSEQLTSQEFSRFMKLHNSLFQGNCGLLERITDLLDVIPLTTFANLLKNNRFNVIRCDRTTVNNYKKQLEFMKIIDPCILAASQDHAFGINNSVKNRAMLLLGNDRNIVKLKKHFHKFVVPFEPLRKFVLHPLGKIFSWGYEILPIVYYGIKGLISILKQLKLIVKN